MYENIIEVYIYSKYVVDDIGTILQSYSFVATWTRWVCDASVLNVCEIVRHRTTVER